MASSFCDASSSSSSSSSTSSSASSSRSSNLLRSSAAKPFHLLSSNLSALRSKLAPDHFIDVPKIPSSSSSSSSSPSSSSSSSSASSSTFPCSVPSPSCASSSFSSSSPEGLSSHPVSENIVPENDPTLQYLQGAEEPEGFSSMVSQPQKTCHHSSAGDQLHQRESESPVSVEKLYVNILQSIGQAVYIFRPSGEITYWNRTAELLFGYSETEVLGCNIVELLVDEKAHGVAAKVVKRISEGKTWAGQIPLRKKSGEVFMAMVTDSPFYDSDGRFLGIVEVSYDIRCFEDKCILPVEGDVIGEDESPGDDSHQQHSRQFPFAAAITNLASKVSSKVTKIRAENSSIEAEGGSGGSQCSDNGNIESNIEENNKSSREPTSSGSSTPTSIFKNISPLILPFKGNSVLNSQSEQIDEGGGKKPGVLKTLGSKAELLVTGLSHVSILPGVAISRRKDDNITEAEEEEEEETENKKSRGLKALGMRAEAWISKKRTAPWLHNSFGPQKGISLEAPESIGCDDTLQESDENKGNRVEQDQEVNEILDIHRLNISNVLSSWSSAQIYTSESISSSSSTTSMACQRNELDFDSSDCEIAWDDLTIGEQIGQGSCGTVYHGLWHGSDVAIKVFTEQDFSAELLDDFKKEVTLMKRLRHPNIVLFMGAAIAPPHLSIITEFLARGSLFRLLRRNTQGVDWKRATRMALDIARGMNYLHHCNPPVVHRDLKSSNLLVDKNWTVKVADFGLSRIKHATFLTAKSGRGTPQWMAPEVLRSEPSNEKADVYSFGVIMWELATEQIPWDGLNAMQVVGAVGFMNQRLQIPADLNSEWSLMIQECWQSDPGLRPSFQEITDRLKEMQKRCATQPSPPQAAQ